MNQVESQGCTGGTKLVFACSGAADVGAVSDRAARAVTKRGSGTMFCMAGIGGRVPGILNTTRAAEKILAVDGCPINCVKKCLEESGFAKFDHLQLADLGLEKGRTAPNDENIGKAVDAIEKKLAD